MTERCNLYHEQVIQLQSTIDGLKKENKQANEFICDIAKLFGEDDLGYDGKQWTIDDFKDAINSTIDEKNKEIEILRQLFDAAENLIISVEQFGEFDIRRLDNYNRLKKENNL